MLHVLRSTARISLSRNGRILAPAASGLGARSSIGIQQASGAYVSRRFNSDNANKADGVVDATTSGVDAIAGSSVPDISNLADAAAGIVLNAPPKVNFVVEQIMASIDYIHVAVGIPYWGAIVVATLGIRALLLPVAIKTIQGSARMAIMRPEMQKIQDVMKADPNMGDMRVKAKYEKEMRALFVKYKVNPLRAILWPLFQFPVFIGVFMALREMGAHYAGFSTGGTLWFTDLSAKDPNLVLPVLNSLSFMAMVELGADGIQVNQQKVFQNAMRGLALVMIPLTMDMPSGLFVYWCTNNVLSLIQTGVLKNEKVRVILDIPKAPAAEDTPMLKMVNPLKSIQEALEKERAQKSNARAEILEGVAAPPGPPSTPPPTSFAMPPRQSRRPKTQSPADPGTKA